MAVVYFDQHLGAAHSKGWLKMLFQHFTSKKAVQRKKKYENWYKIDQNLFICPKLLEPKGF